MRIATFENKGKPAIGIVEGDRILDLDAAFRKTENRAGPQSMLELIAAGPALLAQIRKVVEKASSDGKLWQALSGVKLMAPVPKMPKNVFCVGRNYKLHIEEGARALGVPVTYPEVPEFFTKPPTAVIGNNDEIRLDPKVTKKLDYEVELAMVVGPGGRDMKAGEAANYIFGYTIVNDVSARDLQQAHGQWFKGKCLDTCAPIGPWIVTADEFGPSSGHAIMLRINGETRQSSTTSDLLFGCEVILQHLSSGLTLEPGDIIATGTPSGVAMGRVPQPWLKDGDIIEAEIAGIGVLRNTVRAVR
jgi:2-keto-4-pentenoate hydratase/2-oxohepta-3-ene-1,7-dioic acid hydratase in catechol pathway